MAARVLTPLVVLTTLTVFARLAACAFMPDSGATESQCAAAWALRGAASWAHARSGA